MFDEFDGFFSEEEFIISETETETEDYFDTGVNPDIFTTGQNPDIFTTGQNPDIFKSEE